MDIELFVKSVNNQNLTVEAVQVLQHGKKIAEHYWIPEAPRMVYSVAKSFTSIALGMVLAEGKISLRDKVIDAFPDAVVRPDARLSALTLEDCLIMSRGYPEFVVPKSVDHVLNQELTYDPGTKFVYDNADTFLVSAMITRATGKLVRDLLIERLFQPLDIPDPEWALSEDGYTIGANGLEISISSMAAFGQLLLQRGNWKGKQLVSANWIDCVSRPHITTKERKEADYDLGYGYQFWMCRHGAYRADGARGKFIVVLPREDAVVAINCEDENSRFALYALWDTILPQLQDK